MTIKGLRELGFDVKKGEGHIFTISNGEIKANIEKVTDTKFKFGNNDPTQSLEILIEQIKTKK